MEYYDNRRPTFSFSSLSFLFLFKTGFSLTLKQLDGTNFTITIDDTIECDEVLRVPGKGMPRRSGRGFGDLFITFEVEFPDSLSDDQKKKLRDILGSTASGDSSRSEL
jgi:DnaJ-class molecular chaperone